MKQIARSMGERQVKQRRLWWAAPAAAIAAALANSAIYATAELAGALPDHVLVPTAAGEKPLGIGEVLFASIVPLIAAGIVLAILVKFTRRPLRVFWPLALGVLVLSLGSPLSLSEAPGRMIAALLSMHLVAAGVGLPVLMKFARPATDVTVQAGKRIPQQSAA